MAQRNITGVNQRPTSSQRKLGRVAAWLLGRRGRRDAIAGTVCKNTNGLYSSPFILQEINLCIARIHKEKEYLQQMLMRLQFEISERNIEVERMAKKLEGVSFTESPELFDYVLRFDDESFLEQYREPMKALVDNTRKAAVEQRKNDLAETIASIQAENEKARIHVKKEVEISRLRENQEIDMLRARLFAYWSGVLSAQKDLPDITPSFDEEFLEHTMNELAKFYGLEGNDNGE